MIFWPASKYSKRQRMAMGMHPHSVRAFALPAEGSTQGGLSDILRGMPLRLVPTARAFPPTSPTDPAWGPNDYAVFDGDRHVGRLYRMTSTATEQWWWGIKAELRRDGIRGDGQEHTREAAMAAFKSAWERP